MDILQQDRREAAEQRQELCNMITRLQEDLQRSEEQIDKVSTAYFLLKLIWKFGLILIWSVAKAGVTVWAATVEGQDSPAGLGDGAEEECVIFQPDHGAGEREGSGQSWLDFVSIGYKIAKYTIIIIIHDASNCVGPS